MRLHLIRHAETVDNISGLYAGVRDSALTNYGHDQARKLGLHFAAQNVQHTHIFCSPLQRTVKTSEAVVKARKSGDVLKIVRVPDLIEQNFGYYEGKPFFARVAYSPRKNGKDAHRERHKNEPGFVDVETKDSMCKRADAFLDAHLMPLFSIPGADDMVVAVVSHGILLGNLWRRLLLRLPRKSLNIASEVSATRDGILLEHLGGWSNTGYLELVIRKDGELIPPPPKPHVILEELAISEVPASSTVDAEDQAVEHSQSGVDHSEPVVQQAQDRPLRGHSTTILAINSKAHLIGLKRQRGGIGRLAHDESQKKISGFFSKKQKIG